MKKLFTLLVVALMMGAMVSCNNNGTASKGNGANKTEDSISNQLGTLVGNGMKMQLANNPKVEKELDKAELMRAIETVLNCDTTAKGKSFLNGLAVAFQMILPDIAQMEGRGVNLDRKAFLSQFKKSLNSKDSVSQEKMQSDQAAIMAMVDRVVKMKAAENDKKGKKYLEEQVKKDKAFKKTASGIAYKILKAGNGANFNDSATVDVDYVGKHIDGKEFDNSQGKPVPMNLKMTVPGFREIISNMKPGEKVLAIIPGALAYGEQGNPQGGIGPNETLVFEITAMGIHKEEPAAMPGKPNIPAGKPAPAPKAPTATKNVKK